MQSGASGSSISERVLAGQEKFNSQFNQRSPVSSPPPSPSAFGSTDNFGRFGDPDAEFNANPLDFNDNLDTLEPPKPPSPLQLRQDDSGRQGFESSTSSSSPQASSLQNMNKPVGFPDSNSNIPERAVDSVSGQSRELTYTEKRLFDEIEDVKAQNNEILRRIQRLEARIRS